MILICGYFLAFFQFLRELMLAHFERQMNKVDSVPAIATGGAIESLSTASDSSQPTETIITDQQLVPKPDPALAPALTLVD